MKSDEFIYCSNWACDNRMCMRHRFNQPWNVPTRQRKWNPDEEGGCKGLIYDGEQRESDL